MLKRSNRRPRRLRVSRVSTPGVESLERRELKTNLFAAVESPVESSNPQSGNAIGASDIEAPASIGLADSVLDVDRDTYFALLGNARPNASGLSEVEQTIVELSVDEAEQLQQEIEQQLNGDTSDERSNEKGEPSKSALSQTDVDMMRVAQQEREENEEDWDDDEIIWRR